jgi:16S rRNA (guanine(527)-N(7))-methyltransferase RsmG
LSTQDLALWQEFIRTEKLTAHQAQQFEQYLSLLLEWNEKINLTRITDFPSIIAYHFQDSLRIADCIDFNTIQGAADVGTGAGFPGIPLCIKFPALRMTLLEVIEKKAEFLQCVIDELGLSNCTVNTLDWRTFLRQSSDPVELFMARASLQPEELVRMFKPSSAYKDGQLVYWASKRWQPSSPEKPFLVKLSEYRVGDQQRVYAFFKRPA